MIEMDETHSENDIAAGRIVLKNVGGQVGIARSTGNLLCFFSVICFVNIIFNVICLAYSDASFSRINYMLIGQSHEFLFADLYEYLDIPIRQYFNQSDKVR